MEYEKLKQYLHDVYTLEGQLHSYRCSETTYLQEIKNLYHVPSIEEDMAKKMLYDEWYHSSTYQKELAKSKRYFEKKTTITFILCLIAYVAILFFCLATSADSISSGFILSLILGVPAVFITFCIGAQITGLFATETHLRDLQDVNTKTGRYYYKMWREPQIKIEAQERLPFAKHLEEQLATQIVPPAKQTQALLNHIYSSDIIHPKYRNFLAVAQIYEYLDTGRCTELAGPNGAYNLYEQELRQNIIIDKLDQVIRQLDRLNRTMGYVASAIAQTNQLLGDISSSLGRIEANTSLTAYNTQCIANNTSIANRYNYR